MSIEPEVRYLSVNQARMCVFSWGEAHLPAVLLVHATGFHARCWDKVVRLLGEGYRVYAVDMRGHGRSDNTPPYVWGQFCDDLLQVSRQLQLQQAVAVGHSMGGHCVAHVAAVDPSLYAELVLVDPVIAAPDMYLSERAQNYPTAEEHPVARRKARFKSWQAMYERYVDRHPYSLWQPEILRDYCQHGVLPVATDQPEQAQAEEVELACPPFVEASIYANNFSNDIYPLLPNLKQPTTVLRAKPRDPDSEVMDFSTSPTWPALAQQLPNAADVLLPELTHFIPMQDPDLVVKYIHQACHNVAHRNQDETGR